MHVQRFGTFLSNMILPNIGAIIAWGLLTAFVIPDGWTPNEKIASLVGPLIFYLLPILIGYTGGRMIYNDASRRRCRRRDGRDHGHQRPAVHRLGGQRRADVPRRDGHGSATA